MIISNNENRTVCSQCGGRCCKSGPCCYVPSDLNLENLDLVGLITKIELTGYISIASSAGFLYLRPKRKGGKILDFKMDGSTECSLLGPNGCLLSFEERPTGGKALIPDKDFKCKSTINERQLYKLWLPYQWLLRYAAESFIDEL